MKTLLRCSASLLVTLALGIAVSVRAADTALDRYVHAPDPAYHCDLVDNHTPTTARPTC
jgi:hypothetical protein